jgi:hypothetical protein
MNRLTAYALGAALGLGMLATNAQASDDQVHWGEIGYISPATLEIGIDNQLFRLDSSFQIRGMGEADRLQLLNALKPGMRVHYKTSGAGGTGNILEMQIQAD